MKDELFGLCCGESMICHNTRRRYGYRYRRYKCRHCHERRSTVELPEDMQQGVRSTAERYEEVNNLLSLRYSGADMTADGTVRVFLEIGKNQVPMAGTLGAVIEKMKGEG